MIDGNDIWEALFGILKGDVPDVLTEDVCEELARRLSTPTPATADPSSRPGAVEPGHKGEG